MLFGERLPCGVVAKLLDRTSVHYAVCSNLLLVELYLWNLVSLKRAHGSRQGSLPDGPIRRSVLV